MESFDGLLVIDKPKGMTSRAVVDRVHRWFPRRTRIGHTGTLDPLATGVLVLCLGAATRLVEYVQDMSKTYLSTFRLGATSDTDDALGNVMPTEWAFDPGLSVLESALSGFVGEIEQTPPAFSAARIAGQRAHEMARRGESVSLTARVVTVYRITILRYDFPRLEVEIHCGKGTYVRSLARDLGAALGCGAYVEELRRLRIGSFTVAQAIPLNATREIARASLLPTTEALRELTSVVVNASQIEDVRRGRRIDAPSEIGSGLVALFSDHGEAVAVAEVRANQLQPVKVFLK